MQALIGFSFSVLLGFATWYGYCASMTLEGFPIQGYIGTALPVLFAIVGACCGAALAFSVRS